MNYPQIILTIFLLNWINIPKQAIPNKTPMKIEFEIFIDSLKSMENMTYEEWDSTKIIASVKRTFTSDTTLNVFRPLQFGYKEIGEFQYVEAYDLEGNEINICGELDYTYGFQIDPWPYEDVENGDFFLDTIYLNGFYDFKNKGTHLLRFVDKRIGKTPIYSNWDTLQVY